jgi:hypothetical protein
MYAYAVLFAVMTQMSIQTLYMLFDMYWLSSHQCFGHLAAVAFKVWGGVGALM